MILAFDGAKFSTKYYMCWGYPEIVRTWLINNKDWHAMKPSHDSLIKQVINQEFAVMSLRTWLPLPDSSWYQAEFMNQELGKTHLRCDVFKNAVGFP